MNELDRQDMILKYADDNYADAYKDLYKWVDLGGLSYVHEQMEELIKSLSSPTPATTHTEKENKIQLTDLMEKLTVCLKDAEQLVSILQYKTNQLEDE